MSRVQPDGGNDDTQAQALLRRKWLNFSMLGEFYTYVFSGFEWKNACDKFGLYLQLHQHQVPKSNAWLALLSNKLQWNLRLFWIIVQISTFFLKPNYKLDGYIPKAGKLQTYLKVCIVIRSAMLKSLTEGCTGVSMSFNHKAHRSPTTVKVRYSNQVWMLRNIIMLNALFHKEHE